MKWAGTNQPDQLEVVFLVILFLDRHDFTLEESEGKDVRYNQ